MATSAITPTTASSTGTTAVKSTGTDSNTLANEDTFMQLLMQPSSSKGVD